MYYYNNAAYLLGLHVVKSLKTLYPVALGEEYIFMFLLKKFFILVVCNAVYGFWIKNYVPPDILSQAKRVVDILGHAISM
jgi:hypothetical protein